MPGVVHVTIAADRVRALPLCLAHHVTMPGEERSINLVALASCTYGQDDAHPDEHATCLRGAEARDVAHPCASCETLAAHGGGGPRTE